MQIISGFLLLGILSFQLDIQFSEILGIVFHGNFVWLSRLLHMLGANFCVIILIGHFTKSFSSAKIVSPNRATIWVIGSAIFLLALGIAFSGYVVVAGNMSYWAALVILSLFSVIPFFGEEIVAGILSGSTVTTWALRRFTVLHFLLAVLGILFLAMHLILLHRGSPSVAGNFIFDGSENLILILTKDLVLFFGVFSIIFLDATKTLVHPDNWASFSRVLTPAHIEPEIYFL